MKAVWNQKLYPLVAILSGVFVIVFGLIMAKDLLACSVFLGAVFVWLMIFGCWKSCLHALPAFIVVAGIFFGIFYAATGTMDSGWSMANRFGAVFLAIVPGMSATPVRMTRSLSQVHTPRAITLGMLISMSFVPMLKGEIGRVREAMKRAARAAYLIRRYYTELFSCPSSCGS